MKFETKMEIDLAKLKSNTNLLCKSYSDYKYKMVDLKDNGHGLGLKIVNTMANNGINYFTVGSLKDGINIRKFNKDVKILVNYYVSLDEIYDAINNNLTVTIYSLEHLKLILSLNVKDDLNVQILIDNGANLMGVSTSSELEDIINLIKENNIFEEVEKRCQSFIDSDPLINAYRKKEWNEYFYKEELSEAIKEREFSIAKTMKKDGADINLISKYTGLTIDEIEKL